MHLARLALLLTTMPCPAQSPPEAQSPPKIEPDPLTTVDGYRIADAEDWRTRRRPELLDMFRHHVYGRVPVAALQAELRVEGRESGPALEGVALRKQWRLRYGRGARDCIDVLAYLPAKASGPVPVFLALNFQGNHTVHDDPAIRLPDRWVPNDQRRGLTDNRPREQDRGCAASRWPVEQLVVRGFGVVTAYYGDLDPDHDDGFRNGVHGVFDPAGSPRPDGAWGAIAAWAWGMSRVLDSLEQDPAFDAARVAVLGHSRLGKTALWAGAEDERFAIVIANESGCGGAALSRRQVGETVAKINSSFPHWFCRRFHAFGDREAELPVDQHLLIALLAPRPAYVGSAVEDRWADPEGEFLSVVGADPVYRLLGVAGFPTTTQPPVGTSVQSTCGYHVRAGKHDLTAEDWGHYIDFASRHFGMKD